jgi:dCTP deaminase
MSVAESQENVTSLKPEWKRFATLEISVTTPLPVKVHANEGLCQICSSVPIISARPAVRAARGRIRSDRG